MKLFTIAKDGGKESTVVGYWLIESKKMFSILLLNFQGKSREAYHTHAFNSISWVIYGGLKEEFKSGKTKYYFPSLKPIITKKNDFHKVDSLYDNTWVISFRGRWDKNWKEFLPKTKEMYTLTSGRIKV